MSTTMTPGDTKSEGLSPFARAVLSVSKKDFFETDYGEHSDMLGIGGCYYHGDHPPHHFESETSHA